MITADSFRWFPYEGHRHAIPADVAPGKQGKTLCGIEVTRPRQPPPKYPDRLWPECPACDGQWRQAERIAPRVNPDHGGGAVTVASRLTSERP